jgi:predicted phosphodiesterase
MRIAILADIHGNVLALEAVLADLKHRKVDQFVNLGDCVSGPLWPCETAELLRQLNWPTVRGNHDRWVTDWPPEKHYRGDAFAFQSLDTSQLAWLRALPSTRELRDGVFACHGRPDDDNAYLLENVERARLVPARRTEGAERVRAVADVLLYRSRIRLRKVRCKSARTSDEPSSRSMVRERMIRTSSLEA